ncbi:MAG: DUF3137 domain-containing protein [Bacilli bacterium]|nr:DUF3137 domain-containing protein [Bacilli bacterium]
MNVDELKELQSRIIKKNKTCNLISIISLIVLLFVTLFIFLEKELDLKFILFGLLFELIFGLVISTIIKVIINGKSISKFNKEYKNIFVLSALTNNFENLTYDFEDGFSEQKIRETGMFNTCDRFTSNDYVSGNYKNIKFEQSDIHIQEEHEKTDADGNTSTYWETIFEGRLMIFDFNKNFMANMLVISNSFPMNALLINGKLSKIKMEDTEFNKSFKVYSDLEHDAFYVLTPHFMEKMKKIYNELKCGIMFGFLDNKLYVAVDNREDSFEYNVFEPIDEKEINNNITKDIKLITDFVNELNLDNDLFKKEV